MVFKRLLGRIDQLVSLVAAIDRFAALLVLVGVGLSVPLHLFDLVLAQPGRGLDADRLLFVGALVCCGHIQDAISIDVEGHLDLRHAARRGRDADQVELAQRPIVGGELAIALQHVDLD